MTTARNLAAFGTVSGQQQDNRNLLHNGAMQVAQRGTSIAGSSTTNYLLDRWMNDFSSLGTWTISQEADGPTGSGFTKSLKYLCTTANASPAAGSYMWCNQRLEGQDLQRIAKGTSSAQSLTLSFWVKSNVTGTFNAFLYDPTANRLAGRQYTISASGTWERKVLTFAGDTTGTLANSNAYAFAVYFALSAGTDFTSGSSTNGSWAANTSNNIAPGNVNLAAAVNNYWQVTGVQLETGPAATPFEFKSYGQELRECQRYYERIYSSGSYAQLGMGYSHTSTSARIAIPFSVPKRTQVTSIADNSSLASLMISNIGGNQAVTGLSFGDASFNQTWITVTTGSVQTAGQGVLLFSNGTAAYLGFSAEL